MSEIKHNLDEGYNEYVHFILKGNEYRLRLMTVEELEKLSQVDENDYSAVIGFYATFVEAVTEGAKPFADIWRKMSIGQMKLFGDMIKEQVGV